MYKKKLNSIKKNLSYDYDKNFKYSLNLVNKNIILVSEFCKKIDIVLNQNISNIYYEELKNETSHIDISGALKIKTNREVNRKNKYIVKDKLTKDIWWSTKSFNKHISETIFNYNRESIIFYLTNKKKLYVFDGFIFFDNFIKLKIRIISPMLCHNLFIYNLLIKPTEEELYNFGTPDFTIYNCDKIPFINDNNSIQINFTKKEILILGNSSEIDIQECIYNIINYETICTDILPLNSCSFINYNKLNMLIGLNEPELFLPDKNKILVSYDKTGWSNKGLCNIINSCYINFDNVNKQKFNDYIKFGTLFNNNSITFPFDFFINVKPTIDKHPDNIFLLTSDIYGILPLASLLTKEQALYYFMNGYTSEFDKATFSACYSEKNLIYHPSVYTSLLKEKLDKYKTNIWLINTGWYGGIYQEGKKYDKDYINETINMIITSTLKKKNFNNLDIFNLKYIKKYNPRDNWNDKNKYDEVRKKLAILFKKNFLKYNNTEIYKTLISHGPQI